MKFENQTNIPVDILCPYTMSTMQLCKVKFRGLKYMFTTHNDGFIFLKLSHYKIFWKKKLQDVELSKVHMEQIGGLIFFSGIANLNKLSQTDCLFIGGQ